MKSKNLVPVSATLIAGLCFAYSLVVRFSHFLLVSRGEKAITLGVHWLWIVFAGLLFILPLVNRLLEGISKERLKIIGGLSLVTAVVIMAVFYSLPAFPKRMELEIRAKGEELAVAGKGITILSMVRQDPPKNIPTPINLRNLSYGGGWQVMEGKLRFSPGQGDSGSVRYTSNIQGEVRIRFQTGPGEGAVDILVNGEGQSVELAEAEEGEVEKTVTIPNTWKNADRVRRVLLMAGLLTDTVTVFLSAVMFWLLVYQVVVKRRLRARGLADVVGLVLVSLVLLFANQQAQREIVFSDPKLEEGVREALGKPEGRLYTHQLLTLIELDLSGRGIRELEGIEGIRNLRVLDLSDNQIENLTPLQGLKKLQKLNLRENRVRDITALAEMKQLTYLNLHSNEDIQDLTPLKNLTMLNSLILRNVPIGDQVSILTNLNRLTYLNIRHTSIRNIEVLVEMMSHGVLQDDVSAGKRVTVNILENEIGEGKGDPFLGLRGYWEKVSYRYPYYLPNYASEVAGPKFSHESGFYEEGFALVLTTPEAGGKIFYSTDGSEPAIDEKRMAMGSTREYTGPITVNDKSAGRNRLSQIETSRIDDYKPPENMFKAMVVRAVVVGEDQRRSGVVTHTYFVEEGVKERFSLPVLSLTVAPVTLFDDRYGIYVPGELYQNDHPSNQLHNTANYTQRGLKWERPAFVELFDPSGEVVFAQEIGIRIHGRASRGYPQKSLRLYAREEYSGESTLQFDFFPGLNERLNRLEVDKFETLILRTGGAGDMEDTMIADIIGQSLLENLQLDIQGNYPVIVFLNGEYWGIHNLRSRYDAGYFQNYYHIPPGDVVVLVGSESELYLGDPGDENLYTDMLRLIDEHYDTNGFRTVSTLADAQAYAAMSELMDMENYIDYNISQIYPNKVDWLGNNIWYWRKKVDCALPESGEMYGHDGKWRWMVIDMDSGFKDRYFNSMENVTAEGSQGTYLFRSLLQNEEFRRSFINRLADLLNTNFKTEVVLATIDEVQRVYEPEMEEHILRWGMPGGSLAGWRANVEEIREFARARPEELRQQIADYFDLAGSAELRIRTDPGKGYVTVNRLEIREGMVGIEDPSNWAGVYFQGVPFTITAVPAEGYRFSHWEGLKGGDSTAQSQEITLTGDLALTAVFVR
ncbi:MAG TPA: CotH kinase family protein [Anaerolineaceae bacterium]|nr:CotH kinase family protein [Anaerolineaceae bacterium]HOS53772.1 CotH kinase family protein [Anaerolineaceae bacterium]HQK04471.1 CotH kinase family protein [Anaerolineaceae bacterium]HRS74621.1 CotH kinase family protein [Anaerolineaceae bacterium]HRT91422.1 CotH kinase family protein [Anaerolineaceae bacterium]